MWSEQRIQEFGPISGGSLRFDDRTCHPRLLRGRGIIVVVVVNRTPTQRDRPDREKPRETGNRSVPCSRLHPDPRLAHSRPNGPTDPHRDNRHNRYERFSLPGLLIETEVAGRPAYCPLTVRRRRPEPCGRTPTSSICATTGCGRVCRPSLQAAQRQRLRQIPEGLRGSDQA